jgi:hypothetical protein
MNIVRYDPFRDIRTLQEEVNRLFAGAAPANLSREDMLNGAWAPKVDIYENKENLTRTITTASNGHTGRSHAHSHCQTR